MILSLCVFGGITLLAHPRRSKAKFILGASMLFWGVLIILRLSFNPFLDCAKTLFQPMILITGSIVMATTTCYVIEVLRPGYLTFRRFCLFISPAIVCSLLFGCHYICSPQTQTYYNLYDLFLFSDTDIFLRLMLLACNMFYMGIQAYLTASYNREYSQFIKENVSDPYDYDLQWLQRAMFTLSALYISYLVLLFTNDTLLYVINKVFILVLWYYLFYKALFLKEIPWKISFKAGWQHPDEGVDENRYEDCISQKINYLEDINQWFESEKPYLRGDLRLSDLQRKFPISRTYLSQLFNKVQGVSFSDYVNRFRIEESKRLLEMEPQTSINEIAERSGFNSISAFRRAFIKSTNISPSEYRKNTVKTPHHSDTQDTNLTSTEKIRL